MPPDLPQLDRLLDELKPFGAHLVAVSKTKPVDDILEVFRHGHADFGENYVQELTAKASVLPEGINWHFIGHLQSNKVKQVIHQVFLVHGTDSPKLVSEIGKQATAVGKVQDILLQVHIASEETKFGFSESELMQYTSELARAPISGVRIRGLMGMASFTDNEQQVRSEFKMLHRIYDILKNQGSFGPAFEILSMGMSNDYKIALEEGSTMVRIGSLVFGSR